MTVVCNFISWVLSLLSLFMEKQDIFKSLSKEEKDKLVNAFAWLIKEYRKQNPNLDKKEYEHEEDHLEN